MNNRLIAPQSLLSFARVYVEESALYPAEAEDAFPLIVKLIKSLKKKK